MDLINLINEYRKNKNKILNILIIIVALFFARRIYIIQTKNINSLSEKKDAELKRKELLEDISQAEKKVGSYKSVINNKDISLVINTLRNIARDSSIKIVSIKPQTEQDYLVYTKYFFDLVITAGDYHRIGKFMSKIESHPDIYIVENISIRSNLEAKMRGKDKIDKLTVNLRLSTILLKG